jgi:hypothetical protein
MDEFCKCGAILAVDGLCSSSDMPPKKCPLVNMDDVENVVPDDEPVEE